MWFRRDLRVRDLPALLAAGADGAEVVPLFVVDPAFASAGPVRLAYLSECLSALDGEIRRRSGTGLVVRRGDPVDVVARVAEDVGAESVFVSRDYAPYGRRRDAAVATALKSVERSLQGVGSPYAVTPGSVRKADGDPYAVFTPFSKVWRQVGWDAPQSPPGGDFEWLGAGAAGISTEPIPGPVASRESDVGEETAHNSWSQFLHGALARYPTDRNHPGVEGTTRLSPALKWGVVHPRQLLADLDASGAGSAPHTIFSSELAWREFYADVLFQQPRTAWENLNAKMDAMPVDTNAAARRRFDRWTAGTTGFGIVDAGMRQLVATGWMHNRVRMIAASFLVKDLHLPWQWGARWFLQHLVDGDLASNNHGWQWAAGTGTDAAPYFRVFNPTLQQERFDPDGSYVERWVPDPVAPMLDHHVERDDALRRLATIA